MASNSYIQAKCYVTCIVLAIHYFYINFGSESSRLVTGCLVQGYPLLAEGIPTTWLEIANFLIW
jgi:hypothetical protein